MNKRFLLIVLLILGTAFWGISFPVTKMAMGAVSQLTFLLYRFLLATIVLTVVLARQLKKITRKNIVEGITLSIPLTLGIYFQTSGIRHTAASHWIPKTQGFWTGIIYCALFSTAYMYTVSNIAQRYISAELTGGAMIFAGTLISEIKLKPQQAN